MTTAPPMRVLHLFSNRKWTGPAEPALNLCIALRELGVHTEFACAAHPNAPVYKLLDTARDRGIEPILRFHLEKYRHLVKNPIDRFRLKRFLKKERFDLVHCHLDNDHGIALGAAAPLGIPVVRSSYHGAGFPNKKRFAKQVKAARFIIQPSNLALETDLKHFGGPRGKMQVVPGAVDIERFDPQRPTPNARQRLSIPPDAFVVGIVARMQRHRRYEDLLCAFKRLADHAPNTHLIVLGAGTHQEEVAKGPARELGLENKVHFPGILGGDDYVGMLNAFDAAVYLVPGSDGTCRAVREIMAMGCPVIATNRGMLSEIITHEQDGLLFDGGAQALHEALERLHGDTPCRGRLAQAARQKATSAYSLRTQASAVLAIYKTLLHWPRLSPPSQ